MPRGQRKLAQTQGKSAGDIKTKALRLERAILRDEERVLQAERGPALKALKAKASRFNLEYLNTLIDPEQCHGVRYPDSLPKATAMVKALIQGDAYVFETDTYEVEGFYLNVLSPVMHNPLLQFQLDSVQSTTSLYGGVSAPDDHVGLFPLVEDAPTPATSADQMWIAPQQTMNLRTEFHWNDQDFSYPPFRGVDSNQQVFYGVPFKMRNSATAPASNGQVRVRITFPGPLPAVSQGNVTAVSSLGTFTLTPTVPTAGDTSQVFVGSAADLAALGKPVDYGSDPVGGRYFSLPGMGFRYTNTTAGSQFISAYTITIDTSASLVETVSQPRLVGIPLPDETVFGKTIDNYRVVSTSNWLQYQGSTLNNGGQAASVLYRGGQSAMETGLYTYQQVAECPDSYSGALRDGTYTIWVPNSDRDMLMRGLNSRERWEYPFIVNVGQVSTPDQRHVLRYRIPINYEIVSRSQIYDYRKPIPDPQAIALAARMLRVWPTSIANEWHLGWIKDILKKAANAGKKTVNWAVDNKDWLIPAGMALGGLIGV